MRDPVGPFETVSVVGLGYIGLPTAAVIAATGRSVVGVDVNPRAVAEINSGRAHFFEPDLDGLVQNAVRQGALRAVEAPEPADAFVIAVPTPVSERNAPDLSYVEAAVRSIAPALKTGDLVVIESTSPVGTTERMSALLAALRPDLRFPHADGEDADIRVAYCPERILPGRMVVELVENDRVIGGISARCTEVATALYRTFARGALLPSDSRTAEMVKLVENASRDVGIAFANELSVLCERSGVDVWEAITLANHHPRVNILKPGPGVGGHCIAVDPWFLIHGAEEHAPLLRAARAVNDGMPARIVARLAASVPKGVPIACLGLAYKADTEDLRQSPAVEVVRLLAEAGFGPLLAVEPHVDAAPDPLLRLGVALAPLEAALAEAAAVLLLVDHRAFRTLSHDALAGKTVLDTRGVLRGRV